MDHSPGSFRVPFQKDDTHHAHTSVCSPQRRKAIVPQGGGAQKMPRLGFGVDPEQGPRVSATGGAQKTLKQHLLTRQANDRLHGILVPSR